MSTFNIREHINAQSLTAPQWILIALCFFIMVVDGMDVAIMGFVAPSIIEQWGISKPIFGAVMGAAPMGLAVGALLAGACSDYFGRRNTLLVSVFFFGMMTILTAYADNVSQMSLFRFLTGLGLGAAMPNASTLLSEYIPEKRKGIILTAMFTGFNLGSGIVGFIAAAMIPKWGWQSVLLLGGILPLIIFVLMIFFCCQLPLNLWWFAKNLPTKFAKSWSE